MTESTEKKMQEATALIKGGMTMTDAVKKAGISTATYYTHMKKTKKRKKYTRKTNLLDVPAATTKTIGKLMLLIGDADEIRSFMGAL